MLHALSYAYAHRRERKGDMRRLWIVRVSAASRAQGLSYGQFIYGLKQAGVDINRKVLADMAVREPEAFARLVTVAKGKVEG
jgi:large subunit ribosomal protein L20